MSCHGFGLLAPNRYEVDLSNELLKILCGQGAAKISKVKSQIRPSQQPHICLEPEAQGHGMTFRVCNLGSKQPHLYSAYVVSVPSQLHTTVRNQNRVHVILQHMLLDCHPSFSLLLHCLRIFSIFLCFNLSATYKGICHWKLHCKTLTSGNLTSFLTTSIWLFEVATWSGVSP